MESAVRHRRRRRRRMSPSSWTATAAGRRLRGLPRVAGHRRGAEAVRRTVEAAVELGIRYLTLFGFSSENWKRPRRRDRRSDGPAAPLSPRRDRRAASQRRARPRSSASARASRPTSSRSSTMPRSLTRDNARLDLTIALSYGGRAEIAQAARRSPRRCKAGRLAPDADRRGLLRPSSLDRRHARSRSPHPHQRRAAHQQFPAVADRLCRAGLHRHAVARFRPRPISSSACAIITAANAATAPPLARVDRRGARDLRLVSALVMAPVALAAVWLGRDLAHCARRARRRRHGLGMGAARRGRDGFARRRVVVLTAVARGSRHGARLRERCAIVAALLGGAVGSGAASARRARRSGPRSARCGLRCPASPFCGSAGDRRAARDHSVAAWRRSGRATAAPTSPARALGGPRLAPRLSPNKTWAGLARRPGRGRAGRLAGRAG